MLPLPGSMRALTFHAPRDVRCDTVPEPSLKSTGSLPSAYK